MHRRIQWPEGKSFAFTIFDDTDYQTATNVAPVYDFLADIGLHTTKSVWPILGKGTAKVGGATCEDPAYRTWVVDLQKRGVEIALHNVTHHTSTRRETAEGLERFRDLFEHYPHTMANHTGCREGIYWGRTRLSGFHRLIYDFIHMSQPRTEFQGHIEKSPLFWGDLCRDKIRYVRNFTFSEINTLKACPAMPYHDPSRPFVNRWFAGTDGAAVLPFTNMLCEQNQERLLAEGGACIMYTHFAQGFVGNGHLHNRFVTLMRRLSRMNGWFVPTHRLLDFLASTQSVRTISIPERSRIERRWLLQKIFRTKGRT
ncbi:MAG: hypothetical protein AABZ34_05030 [Nitrospirota bacterium]